jgi:hypothetical protein
MRHPGTELGIGGVDRVMACKAEERFVEDPPSQGIRWIAGS